MKPFQLVLPVAALSVFLVFVPQAAHADQLGYARHWMAQRFHPGSGPSLRREVLVNRPAVQRRRTVAAHPPPDRAARSPAMRHVAHRQPAQYMRPAQRVVYRPQPVVYVVPWPF